MSIPFELVAHVNNSWSWLHALLLLDMQLTVMSLDLLEKGSATIR